MNAKAHPEWGKVHQDALLAGFLTALTLWRIGAPLAEQMESFQAGENHGIVGLTLRTPDDTRSQNVERLLRAHEDHW